MDEIIPGIFLGPWTECVWDNFVKRGIDRCICVDKVRKKRHQVAGLEDPPLSSITWTSHITEEVYPNGFRRLLINRNDSPEENILEDVPYVNEFLRLPHMNVYFHCGMGMSRSPSYLIGFLMLQMSFDESYSLVKMKRPIVTIRPEFLEQLRSLK